jgi:hypothetical protein
MSLSSGSQKFFSSAGVRIRGALLSIGSRPYFFADLCQELDTASIPGGGVAPSATEQTCSACPTIVPSELAERSITAPGSRWRLIAIARRPVSDYGETRCRGERRPQSTADTKKALSKRPQGTPRGVPPQSPQRTELFSRISSADPDSTIDQNSR